MFYPTTNRFLIFCFIAIGTVGADSSDDSDDNPSQAPKLNDGYRKHNAIKAIQDVSTDDRDNINDSDDNPSVVPKTIDNEPPVIPEHNAIEAIENETCGHRDDNDLQLIVSNPTTEFNAIEDETSENSDDEWFCVDPKRYDPFQRKLNRFFARRYSHGHHHYPRGHRHCPSFYQHYPRGYRCELIEYIVYQNTVGFLYKVGGIFGRKTSKTVEEKEILVYEDMRRNIQWTWP